MLFGSGVVSLANFGYNVSMARLLGPAEFGHVTAVATLLMLASAVTLSFQLVCAKFIARNTTSTGKALIHDSLMRRAWIVGAAIGAGMIIASPAIAGLLRLPSPMLIVLLGVGLLFYPALGVRRGVLQGECNFRFLSGNFVLEALVKLLMALLFVAAGFGSMGAVTGITLSLLAALIFSRQRFERTGSTATLVPASFREAMQVIVFFVGQVVLSNIDILLVKYFFAPTEAGLYAAVALVGRLLYFAAWSIVSAMFPVSASNNAEPDKRPDHVLFTPLLLVLLISTVYVGIMAAFPRTIVTLLFGTGFVEAEPLLSLYATATGLYALSVVLMTYEMSRRIANTGWLQLMFSGLMVLGIGIFHSTLRDVVQVQLVIMTLLLFAVSIPFLREYTRKNTQLEEAA
ncbi:MAG TPA: oligosaccharide flippase family protein [Terriglobales bacterium]|nr:oligosaccharide flippase family protein [Terriglobales bacterium]